ncbi:MAG: hypothetical protein MnENMB40S_00940 [Rhizobiaceae bacterium MnEN-MB40S]|nr:MAG: hypothetical protein MnENMB40S_00940 [Rhizobiaceae bacterium MnEN-MB40S]
MLGSGFQQATIAAFLAFLVFVVLPKACGGEPDQEAAETETCEIHWTGRGYEIQCEETEE